MKNKGFTLIELLAVILILGVIALIAIPTVNSIVTTTKINAKVTTTSNVVSAIETDCQVKLLKGELVSGTYSLKNMNIEMKGKQPNSGFYTVDDECNVTIAAVYDEEKNYCFSKSTDVDSIVYYEVDESGTCLPKKEDITPASCFTYTENNNELTITGYTCGGTVTGISGDDPTNAEITSYSEGEYITAVIPNTINGKKAVAIADYAFVSGDPVTMTPDFTKKTIITGLVIPNSVKTIGNCSFSLNKIKTLVLGDNIESIGMQAFAKNNITGNLDLPDKITNLGDSTFAQNFITSLTLNEGLTTIESGAFYNNDITSLTLNESLTSIGAAAFLDNAITSLTLNKNLTSIGSTAFSDNDITSLTFNENLTSIGNAAFSNNKITGKLVIPNNVAIGEGAFNINDIRVLELGSGVTIDSGSFSVWKYGDFPSNTLLSKIINKTGGKVDWGKAINWDIPDNFFEEGTYTVHYSTTDKFLITITKE